MYDYLEVTRPFGISAYFVLSFLSSFFLLLPAITIERNMPDRSIGRLRDRKVTLFPAGKVKVPPQRGENAGHHVPSTR